MRTTLDAYWRLMRLDKPIGIFLLLWPALWALWIAGKGHPDPAVVVAIALGTVVMRSAGCVINDVADRRFDPHVARTRLRPIAAGEISPRAGVWLFIGLCLLGLAIVFTLNPLTRWLSIPGAFLAASYPFTKRLTHLPQAYLGIAFGWAVPMSFAAQQNAVPQVAWLLFAATALWALIYDTMYAMVDREDDRRIGVRSTALLFGRYDRLLVGVFQSLMLALLWLIGRQEGLSTFYNLGLLGALGLFLYQQWLIRQRNPEACFRGFLNNHYVGAVVFGGLALDALGKAAG